MEKERAACEETVASVIGVILAGGRSRRMGGEAKAFVALADQPMLQAVIDRFRPQVGQLLLSVEQVSPQWDPFGLEQVPDPRPGSNGPLGGLLAALDRAIQQGASLVALVPCDAPFLPESLVSELGNAAVRQASPVAVVRYGGRIQPVFSLWSTALAGHLREAVTDRRMAGFMQYLRVQEHAILDWPQEAHNPFFNINDRGALEQARRRIGQKTESEQCSA